MKIARTYRSLATWTLFFCVLVNVFACGLGHGEMSGMRLNGIGGQFCSAVRTTAPAFDLKASEQPVNGWAAHFSCPVCSTAIQTIALFLVCSGSQAWASRNATAAKPAARPHPDTCGPRPIPALLLPFDALNQPL